MANGANADVGTQERADYENLAALDRSEQFREFLAQGLVVQRAMMDFMGAAMRLMFPPGMPASWGPTPRET